MLGDFVQFFTLEALKGGELPLKQHASAHMCHVCWEVKVKNNTEINEYMWQKDAVNKSATIPHFKGGTALFYNKICK